MPRSLYLPSVALLALWFAVTGQRPARGAEPQLVLQTGHTFEGTLLAFSPDGCLLLSEAPLTLWDTSTGHQIRTFQGLSLGDWEKTVRRIGFSPDGQQVLGVNTEGTAVVWETATGKKRWTSKGPTGGPAIVSPDRRYVLTGTWNRAVLWDAATGKELRDLHGQKRPDGYDRLVIPVVFSPDGGEVLTHDGGREPLVVLWDVATGQKLRQFEELGTYSLGPFTEGPITPTTAAFSPDGREVIAGTEHGALVFWDTATGRLLRTFQPIGQSHFPALTCVSFTPDGRRVLACSKYSTAIRDVETGREVQTFGEKEIARISARLSPDGKQVGIRTLERITLWDVETGRKLRTLPNRILSADGVALASGGQQVVTNLLSFRHPARLWDFNSGRSIRTFDGNLLGVSPDGRTALTQPIKFFGETSMPSSTTVLWDVATGRKLQQFRRSGETGAVTPDGQKVLIASEYGKVTLWDVPTGKELRSIEVEPGSNCAIFSPDGQKMAFVSSRGVKGDTLVLADTATGKTLHRFPEDNVVFTRLRFTPDGRQVLANAQLDTDLSQGIVRRSFVWDVATGEKLDITPSIETFAISPDGHRWLIRLPSKDVVLWDVETDRAVWSLDADISSSLLGCLALPPAAFTPDGQRLLTATQDGAVRIWDAAAGRELARWICLRDSQEWLVVTPEGYFDGSPGGRKLVTWRVAGEVFPMERYEAKFHRPDLVARALAGLPIEAQPPDAWERGQL